MKNFFACLATVKCKHCKRRRENEVALKEEIRERER